MTYIKARIISLAYNSYSSCGCYYYRDEDDFNVYYFEVYSLSIIPAQNVGY